MAKRRRTAKAEPNANTPVADVRKPNGQWVEGHTPPGAKPFLPGEPSGNPGGRPKGVLGRMQALAREQPVLLDKAATLPFRLMEDEAQEGATRLGALKVVLDRLDGAVALKVEGLTEAHLTAFVQRAIREGKKRLPPEHWQAMAEALFAAADDEEPRDVEIEAPAGLPPAPEA